MCLGSAGNNPDEGGNLDVGHWQEGIANWVDDSIWIFLAVDFIETIQKYNPMPITEADASGGERSNEEVFELSIEGLV